MNGSASATSWPATSPSRGRIARNDLRARPAERGALSFGQQRLWFLDRWLHGSPVYHSPVMLTFRGPVDACPLRAPQMDVAARHDILFSVISTRGGEPSQRRL